MEVEINTWGDSILIGIISSGLWTTILTYAEKDEILKKKWFQDLCCFQLGSFFGFLIYLKTKLN